MTPRDHPPSRRSPNELRLPVPFHTRIWGAVLGACSAVLGFVFLTEPVPHRSLELEARSVVAVAEIPLGWALLAAGGWVVVATVVGQARASAHAVASIVHLAHLVVLVATFVIAYPLQPAPVVVTSVFAFIAHGGASLDYWARGWR